MVGAIQVRSPAKAALGMADDIYDELLCIYMAEDHGSGLHPGKMLTLESRMFPVLGEVSCCIRTLPNRKRNGARGYYNIVLSSNYHSTFYLFH